MVCFVASPYELTYKLCLLTIFTSSSDSQPHTHVNHQKKKKNTTMGQKISTIFTHAKYERKIHNKMIYLKLKRT